MTMNKRIPGIAVISLGLLVATGATVSAQQPAHTETTVKTTGAGPNTKSKTESVTGTVKDYEAGKKIKIEGPGGKDYSFDLDENAHVKGSIVVGQKAKVSYSKSADGVEKVTVLSETGASSGAAMGSDAPRMHTESTVKHTGEGPNTKTKKEIVVGTVKSFEPGKKIKVTGPGDKDFSFDLDEASGVQGNVSIGERVKVTYTKTDNGDKVTTVQPYHGK
jgi:ABC-type glycerol-3-phosphate transport system substrate-binding protein